MNPERLSNLMKTELADIVDGEPHRIRARRIEPRNQKEFFYNKPGDDTPGNQCVDPERRAYPCPLCNGYGVIGYDVPVGHSLHGKLGRCPNNPASRDEGLKARLRKSSGLAGILNHSLSEFLVRPLEIGNAGHSTKNYTVDACLSLRHAKYAAVDLATTITGLPEEEQAPPWLLLRGATGVGKTHLAAGICNAAIDHGIRARFFTAPDLLDHLRSAYDNKALAFDSMFSNLLECPVLALDDLGTENATEWAQEKLFALLDGRYSARRHTIITTNLALDTLEPRLASRLSHSEVVRHIEIDAPDFRKGNGAQTATDFGVYAGMTLDSWSIDGLKQDQASLRKARHIAKQYAEDCAANRLSQPFLTLFGDNGTGKTHLAAAIANEVRVQGKIPLFLNVPAFLDDLRETFESSSSARYGDLWAAAKDAKVLILDDLLASNSSRWANEKLFQLIDHRYLRRMPTIITTSDPAGKLYDRFASRIFDKRVAQNFEITARPYVMRQK